MKEKTEAGNDDLSGWLGLLVDDLADCPPRFIYFFLEFPRIPFTAARNAKPSSMSS